MSNKNKYNELLDRAIPLSFSGQPLGTLTVVCECHREAMPIPPIDAEATTAPALPALLLERSDLHVPVSELSGSVYVYIVYKGVCPDCGKEHVYRSENWVNYLLDKDAVLKGL